MAAMNEPDDWRPRGACVSADPELFFPISSVAGQRQEAEAKAFCALCQVRPQCLTFALATSQCYGVWGGTTEDERRRLRLQAAASPPETVGAGPGDPAPGPAGSPA
jgi:WhiB family redox-sensing transcriptional regulator